MEEMKRALTLAFAAICLSSAPVVAQDGATVRAYCEAESSEMQIACSGMTEGLATAAYWFTLIEGSPYYGTVCVPPETLLSDMAVVVKNRMLHPLVDLEQISPALALEALQLKYPCE